MDLKTKEFNDFLKNVVKAECSNCGAKEWSISVPEWTEKSQEYLAQAFALSITNKELEAKEIINLPSTGESQIVFHCLNCGYTKLFNAAFLHKKFIERGG
jgi:predicted nucleic-acid-binding Zn-ribbon protein